MQCTCRETPPTHSSDSLEYLIDLLWFEVV